MSKHHKSKKAISKKDQTHVIPTSKTARGRRPHTEQTSSEPYQTSLLADADWDSSAAVATVVGDEAVDTKVSTASSVKPKKSTKNQF